MYLIPAGSEASNPSELLLSQRMKDLLDPATPIFDWIIIDSPPVLPVHDASILGDSTDGVLLVVRAGSTHAEVAEKVAGEFREKNLLGVVLNRVEKSDSYWFRLLLELFCREIRIELTTQSEWRFNRL